MPLDGVAANKVEPSAANVKMVSDGRPLEAALQCPPPSVDAKTSLPLAATTVDPATPNALAPIDVNPLLALFQLAPLSVEAKIPPNFVPASRVVPTTVS